MNTGARLTLIWIFWATVIIVGLSLFVPTGMIPILLNWAWKLAVLWTLWEIRDRLPKRS